MPGGGKFVVVDQAANVLQNLDGYVSAGMDITLDTALDIVETEKDQSTESLKELQDTMMQFASMDRELKEFREALQKMKDEADRTEVEGIDLEAILDEKIAEQQAKRKKDLSEHDRVKEMSEKIQDYLKDTTEEPAQSEPTQIDEDIAMTQTDVNIKCPYTGKPMKNPVYNIHCKHNYDKEGIMEMIGLRKGRAKCPVPGCVNEKPVRVEHLQENKDLKRIVDKKVRQQGKRKK